MRKNTIKEKILKCLLESEKTTSELANELGFVDENNNVQYNRIDKDLKSLVEKGYIDNQKIKSKGIPGNIPTVYSFVYDMQTLAIILNEYPGVVYRLQENDAVLNLLVKNHHSLLVSLNGTDDYTVDRLENEFKMRLKRSLSFFELCLKNSTEELLERANFLDTATPTIEHENSLCQKIRGKFVLPKGDFVFDIIFETCVGMDILMGNSNIKDVDLSKMSPLSKGTHMALKKAEYYLRDDAFYLCDQKQILDDLSPENLQVMEIYLDEYGASFGIDGDKLENCSPEEIRTLFEFVAFNLKLKDIEHENKISYSGNKRIQIFNDLKAEGELEYVVGYAFGLSHPLRFSDRFD